MSNDKLLTLTIGDLSRGGSGIAREPSGRAVFVPLTAPGDKVRARITEEDKRFAQAELVEILEPSPHRTQPRCAVFGRCGGCTWQHVPYDLQWKTKIQGVKHALKRVGIENAELEELPAENPWTYRNRIQLRGHHQALGFYARKSHEIVNTERCEIADERINAEFPKTREEGSKLPREYKVEIETTPEGGTRKSWNAPHAAAGFRQINEAQNVKLQQWVRSRIEASKLKSPILYDLYGGSGNLSLPVRDLVSTIHCVDTTAPQETSEGTLQFHRSPVRPWLLKHKGPQSTAFAILDPPRKGLEDDFTQIESRLSELGVAHLIAVGCEPDPWARDVSRFLKRGWRIRQLASLDFFPQTPHVESVAWLEKLTTTN